MKFAVFVVCLVLALGWEVDAAVAPRSIQAEFVRINTGTIEARDKLNLLLADALLEVSDVAVKNHVIETDAVSDIINEVKVYVTDCIALGKTAIGSLQVERKAKLDDLFNTHLYGNVELAESTVIIDESVSRVLTDIELIRTNAIKCIRQTILEGTKRILDVAVIIV